MNRKHIIVLISWIAVILWMFLIFNLSSQVADESDKLSKGITEIVIKTVEKVEPRVDFDISRFNHIVRKNAHFFAYLALGIFVMNAMRRSGRYGYKSVVLVLLICILYAISDEVHQLFVPGRGPGVKDVLIDSAGASVGTLVHLGMSRIKKKVMIRT
ncbi:VanZ family protein [Marinisporobacter balticus]|uniref:VanZ family protein n=1 Tax=Marinisporobacter balticus TaxID=2018667 RepID=A0A4R2K976_9FIRM|nr:VanZ family protein [Marinisporobacter balticus]TCO68517.1 VanZ family protein [Marinisporobacter balticus]